MKSDWDILVEYVAGETPAEERPRVERWIREDPERERLLAELRTLWNTRPEAPDVDAAWARLAARLEEPHLTVVASTPARAAPRPWWTWALRAAVIAAALLGGAALVQRLVLPGADPEAAWAEGRVFSTERGELSRVRLEDGTEVVLGVRSRLRVPTTFGNASREVRLEGEAYFDVTADPERPFVVHVADAAVRVLGTEFGVRARSGGETRVVVVGGRVLLSPRGAAGEGTELGAGQLGRVAEGTAAVAVEEVDPATHLTWLEGRLVFENATLSEVLEQLALWYDVDFRIGDAALAARRLNASFERAPIAEVLHGIALATNASYGVDGRTVTFMHRP